MEGKFRCTAVALLCVIVLAINVKSTEAFQAAEPKKPPFTISRKTTYLTEPLTEDGYVDYAMALDLVSRNGVTPENNFVVEFFQIIGPDSIHPNVREKFFQHLGIEPIWEHGDYYTTFEKFAKTIEEARIGGGADRAKQFRAEWDRAAQAPWREREAPYMNGWLYLNKGNLDRLVEASRLERFYVPRAFIKRSSLVTWFLPVHQRIDEPARLLTARAMVSLEQGEVESAWEDILACHRVAHLVGRDRDLIGRLVALRIESRACAADAQLAHHGKLSARQAERFRTEFDELLPFPPLVELIDQRVRFEHLETVAWMTQHGLKDFVEEPVDESSIFQILKPVLTDPQFDWDAVLAAGNNWFDRCAEAARRPTAVEREQAMEALYREFESADVLWTDADALRTALGEAKLKAGAVNNLVTRLLQAMLIARVDLVLKAEHRYETRRRLTTVVFALAGYRADNGRYPAKLTQLTPKYLSEIPTDLYTGKALHYRADESEYVLYSVGNNGKDDGGSTFNSVPPGDDIVVRTAGFPKSQ
jgi:hypothetical protein